MSLGQNIKNRRDELGMTQLELAKKLGYKDRSTIAKIESDVNDLTQPKIYAIAKALDTTPADLMGLEIEQPAGGGLSELDEQIMEFLSVLTVEQKQMLLAQLRILTEGR